MPHALELDFRTVTFRGRRLLPGFHARERSEGVKHPANRSRASLFTLTLV